MIIPIKSKEIKPNLYQKYPQCYNNSKKYNNNNNTHNSKESSLKFWIIKKEIKKKSNLQY